MSFSPRFTKDVVHNAAEALLISPTREVLQIVRAINRSHTVYVTSLDDRTMNVAAMLFLLML